MTTPYLTPAALLATIGNVVTSETIDDVLYTLAADAVVRVNDAETGYLVHRVTCPSMVVAETVYRETVVAAERLAAGA